MKWANWMHEGDEYLKELFEESIKQCGEVQIVTVLNSCNAQGDVRHISAFVPVKNEYNGRAEARCIAREVRLEGGGMDMGYSLAYDMYMSVYHGDKERPYQKYLRHSWL